MKEKSKKIVARVGAMVAAVLLVALCALPIFAEEREHHKTYKDYLLETYGGDDAAWALIYNYFDGFQSTPMLYEFFFQWDAPLGTTSMITYDEIPFYMGDTVVTSGSGDDIRFYVFENCYWTTSHTTRNGMKYVYFDLNEAIDVGDGYDITRVLRLRMNIDAEYGMFQGVTVTCDKYTDLDGVDPMLLRFATACSYENSMVVDYMLSRGFATRSTCTLNYNTFVRSFDEGVDVGYDNGYYQGYNVGKNVGYDDGMKQTSLINGVTAIFRAPMELINSVLNFEILGINMAVAVRVLISMAILGVVITVIWKAVK